VREICGLRDPDGSGEGQFVVEDGGKRAFASMGFRLGHNGKGSNGFLEASSSSALKCMNTYGSIDQPDPKHLLSHSYPPNHENHENHAKQTAPQPCFPLQQTSLLPLKNLHHHSCPLSTLPSHQPPPSTTHTCPPSPNPKTQPNQTFFHPLPHATAITPRDSHHENPFTPAPAPPLHPQVFPTPPTASSKTTAAQIIRLHLLDAAFTGSSTSLV